MICPGNKPAAILFKMDQMERDEHVEMTGYFFNRASKLGFLDALPIRIRSTLLGNDCHSDRSIFKLVLESQSVGVTRTQNDKTV
jgi:hypothetical protein